MALKLLKQQDKILHLYVRNSLRIFSNVTGLKCDVRNSAKNIGQATQCQLIENCLKPTMKQKRWLELFNKHTFISITFTFYSITLHYSPNNGHVQHFYGRTRLKLSGISKFQIV